MASLQALMSLTELSPTLLYYLAKRHRKRERVSHIYASRDQCGEFHHIYDQLRRDPPAFFSYARMKPETFDYIAAKIKTEFHHKVTNFQRPIEVEERLMLTIRFLATGTSYRQLAFSFRISKSAISVIVKEVCTAIWKTMAAVHMPTPSVERFEENAQQYFLKWGFPHVLGSLDGKHIRIKCPPNSGSSLNNDQQISSIVLMVVSDANYKFVMIDVGPYGKDNDGGVFANTILYKDLESGKLVLPYERTLPNSTLKAPYVFLTDKAFPLRKYLMRPFPARQASANSDKQRFNYNLCRTRTGVDCTFGIMTSKFRVLLRPIETSVQNAVHIVKAVTLIHNVIIDREGTPDEGAISDRPSPADKNFSNIRPSRNNNRCQVCAIHERNTFLEYFKQRDAA